MPFEMESPIELWEYHRSIKKQKRPRGLLESSLAVMLIIITISGLFTRFQYKHMTQIFIALGILMIYAICIYWIQIRFERTKINSKRDEIFTILVYSQYDLVMTFYFSMFFLWMVFFVMNELVPVPMSIRTPIYLMLLIANFCVLLFGYYRPPRTVGISSQSIVPSSVSYPKWFKVINSILPIIIILGIFGVIWFQRYQGDLKSYGIIILSAIGSMVMSFVFGAGFRKFMVLLWSSHKM